MAGGEAISFGKTKDIQVGQLTEHWAAAKIGALILWWAMDWPASATAAERVTAVSSGWACARRPSRLPSGGC